MKRFSVGDISSSVLVTAYRTEKCTKLAASSDQGLRQFLFENKYDFLKPDFIQLDDTYCKQGKKLCQNLLEFKACLNTFPALVFGSLAQSIDNLLKKNCKGDGQLTDRKLVNLFDKCLTVDYLNYIQNCATNTLTILQKFANLNEAECTKNRLGWVSSQCQEEDQTERIEDFLGLIRKGTFEMVCKDYNSIEV